MLNFQFQLWFTSGKILHKKVTDFLKDSISESLIIEELSRLYIQQACLQWSREGMHSLYTHIYIYVSGCSLHFGKIWGCFTNSVFQIDVCTLHWLWRCAQATFLVLTNGSVDEVFFIWGPGNHRNEQNCYDYFISWYFL